ncbi:MAG: leucine-rich repeat domain-containing protein [Clostridia bacterium]|nr:leucine-rich repeat domain-containing protein [Clostridia bacterium]
MKKRFLAFVLAFVMVLGVAPLNGLSEIDLSGLRLFNLNLSDFRLPNFSGIFAAEAKAADATSGTCGGALTWSYDAQTKTLTISGSGNMTDYAGLRAPWDSYRTSVQRLVIGSNVNKIGNSAFSGCTGLTEINYNAANAADLPNTNTSFSNAGTAGEGIAVTFGDSVEKIPANLFNVNNSNKPKIKSVTISNSVTSIGPSAFFNCTGLTSVTIGNSVTSIGTSAFYNCTGLTSVTIGNSVTSIGDYAFYGCSGLTSITIPDSVTRIVYKAFSDCTGLTEINYNAANAADLTSSSEVFYNAGTAGEGINVTFGDSVEKIPANLFNVTDSSNSPNIKSVTIGNSVTSIGKAAFSNCTGLTSVTIGNSVTSIGNYAFYNCTGLTEINYNAVNAADLTSSSEVFYNAGTAGEGINVTFGDSVEKIPAYLFYASNRPNIKSVTIGNSVTSIGDYAFSGCSRLTSVTIGNSVTSIGNSAFYNCTGLTSITIPDSVTSIGNKAFYCCTGLTSVTIGNSVTGIGDYAFYGCTGLTEINYNAKNAADLFSESQVFMNAGSTGRRIDVTFGDGVENIPAYLFYNQPYVKTVTLTNSVKTIGRYAFQDSTGLTDIYFYGTEEEWNSIRIRDYNNCLYDSDIHYLHAHRYTVSEIVPATCSEYGRVTYICECGATYEEQTPKLPHTPAQAVRENEVPATCTAEGSYESVVYCSVCGEEIGRETVTVNATGHNLINHEGKASTCSEAGYAAYDTCSRCDYSTYEELPLAEHTPATEVKENTVAATCTENGSYDSVVYCSVCGEELSRETVTVNAPVHIPAEAVKENEIPSTNTSDGSYDSVIYCSVCGAEISRETFTVPKDTKKCGNNLTYRYDNSTKTLTISGTGEMYDNMYTKFSIYSNLLFKCKNVVIEDGATSIGQLAFYNMSTIENVSIPASVKTIGRSAFSGCSALVNVTVSDGVENINTKAFYECSALTEIILPDSIKTVGTEAFYGCYGLKNYGGYGLKIFMPNSVENIGPDAFYGTDLFLEGTAEEWNEKFEASGGGNGAGKHYYTETAEQSATCTLQGNTAYSYWSDTDPVLYITEPVFTPATGHTPAKDVRENLVAATSESAGSYDSVVYCSVCGEELSRKTTVIPKTAQNAEIFTFTADKTEAVRGSTVTFTVVASSDINMIRLVDVIDGDENNPVGIGYSKASVGSGFTDNGDGTAVWIIPLTVSLSDYTNENEANEYTLYYYDASLFSCNAADVESIVVNVTKYDNSAAVNEVGGEAVEPFSIINATADLGKKLTYTNITITTTSDVTKLRLTVDGKAVTYSAKSSNVTYTDNGDGTATWVIGYRFTKAENYEILVESRGNSWEGCSSTTVATTIYNTAAELAAAKS